MPNAGKRKGCWGGSKVATFTEGGHGVGSGHLQRNQGHLRESGHRRRGLGDPSPLRFLSFGFSSAGRGDAFSFTAIAGITNRFLPCSKYPACSADFSKTCRARSFCFSETPNLAADPGGRSGEADSAAKSGNGRYNG